MDKKYLLNVCIYFFSGIFALFLIFFVLFHLGSAGETNYPTAVASRIEMESGFEATGYIFRDERVLEAPEGCAYTTLKTGENINKGTVVSTVYPKNEETEQRLAEIETELRLLEAGEKSGQLSDITARLKSYSAGLRETIADGQPGLFLQQEASALSALLQRKLASGAVKNYAGRIAALNIEKEELLAKAGSPIEQIKAPVSGNYYPVCDGYEALFHTSLTDSLTVSSFSRLIADPGQPEPLPNAGKIAESSLWQLALLTDCENATALQKEKTYSVRFSDGQEFRMTLSSVSVDYSLGKTLLVFSSRETPEKVLSRCTEVTVVAETYKGLFVPAAAVRRVKTEEGQVTGVYTQRGNKIFFKKITILSYKDGYFLAKEYTSETPDYKSYLALNDQIITGGKGVTEGYAP